MLDFLKRAVAVLRRPLFREPERPPVPETVSEPAPVAPPREPTLEELHERLQKADLRLHVSVRKTWHGARLEYHVGPADEPFKDPFLNPESPHDRMVSFKVPARFQDGLRQHLLDSNTSRWQMTVPHIGSIDYQFESGPDEGNRKAISGLYSPKGSLRYPARGKLQGLGTYLELKALGPLKKMGVTHLSTMSSRQLVSDKRQAQLGRRGLEPFRTYSMKTWARHLARPVRPSLRHAA